MDIRRLINALNILAICSASFLIFYLVAPLIASIWSTSSQQASDLSERYIGGFNLTNAALVALPALLLSLVTVKVISKDQPENPKFAKKLGKPLLIAFVLLGLIYATVIVVGLFSGNFFRGYMF